MITGTPTFRAERWGARFHSRPDPELSEKRGLKRWRSATPAAHPSATRRAQATRRRGLSPRRHERPCGRRPASHTEYVQQRASRGRRPGSHNALVSAALGRLSTRQLPRRTGSHNALAGAAQPLTPIGTHSGILSSSAPLRRRQG